MTKGVQGHPGVSQRPAIPYPSTLVTSSNPSHYSLLIVLLSSHFLQPFSLLTFPSLSHFSLLLQDVSSGLSQAISL